MTADRDGDGDGDTPRTRTVAAALDVAPDQLRRFAEFHPNPAVEDVLALADRPPADADTRETIRRWLGGVHRRRNPDPDDLPGAPSPYRYSRMMRDDPGDDAPAGEEP